MNPRTAKQICLTFLTGVLLAGPAPSLHAQLRDPKPADVLTAEQWSRTDAAVERGLAWLAAQQQADGSFPSLEMGQPGVTGLAILAFMSHGHVPGSGPYGDALTRAADYVAGCQKQNGLIALAAPEEPTITRQVEHIMGVTTVYNHGIGSLVLSEIYGTSGAGESGRYRQAIVRAIQTTLSMQRWPKDAAKDRGGWRYIDDYDGHDSDLSITGWHLMFLRSSRNAGFDVPEERIAEAIAYVRRCYDPQYGTFEYVAQDARDDRSRAMSGAGILALAHAGLHSAAESEQAGEWILANGFTDYNGIWNLQGQSSSSHDRYHYSLFNCCQGMYQLGGRHWDEFFPPTVETLLANQQSDGSWPVDTHHYDSQFGSAYTTALVLMTLGAPNQLLPIFQR
jgi:hypothetical protein